MLRPQPYLGRLLVVPFDKLRPVDRRYLDLERRHALDCGDILERLPQPLRDIAAIQDVATLVRAAAHFRGKQKAEVLEVFEQCVDKSWNDQLWLLSPLIFEPCPTCPDFWFRDPAVLSEPAWPEIWPYETMILRGQPILSDTTHEYLHSGPAAPGATKLIAWAKEHATMRSTWPAPELIPELVNETNVLADERHRARYQAWRLVRHLFDLEWQVAFEYFLHDEPWERLHELCTSMEVDWDEDGQRFWQTNGFSVPAPPDNWIPRRQVPTPSVRQLLVRGCFDDGRQHPRRLRAVGNVVPAKDRLTASSVIPR